MSGPLNGVRVLDLTAIYSGPICASILGDHGADVIKVEPPVGDTMRGSGHHALNGVPGPFAMLNRNKRSLVLDLKKEEGKQVFQRMVEKADVVLENFRPGVLERMGFGWDVMHKLNPRLIYCSITGLGNEGPYSNRRVYDAVVQAISGIATLQADPTLERPQMVNTLICDKITAITAAQNICSALYAREHTGKGQRLEVSMLDSSLFFLWPDSMASFTFVGREQELRHYASHRYFVRETKDGYVVTMPVRRGEWEGLFTSLELDDLLLDDPRFNTPVARRQNSAVFQQLLNDAYKNFTTEELCTRFEKNEVPYAEVNSRAGVIDDPQIEAMGALMEFDHPYGGRMRQPRPPGRFSETSTDIFRTSPDLGEHSQQVLEEFGFSSEEISELVNDAVIHQSSD